MRKLKIFLLSMILFSSFGVFAQNSEVSGKITDASGSPIPGATVKVKGSKTGTSASADGSFKLMAPLNSTLVISGIGFESKEVKFGSLTSLTITLAQDTRALNEVVVTGTTSATSKRKLGITVESISADKLPAAPTASIDQALVGKISGAQISSISGNPGDPVNIVLRGINTVQGGTSPIILIDGVEAGTTNLNALDLSSIDRVEVVKGAASASLYGAQGANGVIQLFTKKGKQGAVSINYSSSYSGNSYINSGNVHKAMMHPYLTDASGNLIDNKGNPLTVDQYGSVEGVTYTYGGAARAGLWDPRNNANKPYLATDSVHYYDHFKEVFQTGSTLNNIISVSGASPKSDFFLQLSNNHTTSPVLTQLNGYLDRTNLTVNLGTELFKGFKIRSVTQLVYTRNTLIPGLGAGVGQVYSFLNTSPFLDLEHKLADGSYPGHILGGSYLSVNSFNPFYNTEYARYLGNTVDVIQNFDATYTINKFVELDAKFGLNYDGYNGRYTYLNQSQNINQHFYQSGLGFSNGTDAVGEIDINNSTNREENFLPSLNIKTDFQNDFHSRLPITTATKVAFDYRNYLYKSNGFSGYTLPLAPPIEMGSTSTQAQTGDYIQPFITYGYLVDQTINYGDYAGVAGGFRSDFSSAFGGGSQAFTFPHANGWVNLASFDFMKNSAPALSYFKLRVAYGEAGIQPGAFQRYATIYQQDIQNNLVYTLPESPPYNTGLKVEVTKETEEGLDFSVKTGHNQWFTQVSGALTFWNRNSSNVIYNVSVPISSGFTQQLLNAITMTSHGYEFSLNIPVLKSRNINWDFTTNWGHQTSKINTIAGGNDIILTTSAGSSSLVLSPGHTIGQIYGHKTITSFSQTDPSGNVYIDKSQAANYVMVNGALVNIATKQIQYTPDKYNLGDPNPKFNASFINAINYKFINLSFQFDWIYGSHLYNQTKEWMSRDGISGDFEKQVNINGQTGAWSAYWSSPYYNILGSTHGGDNDGTRDYYYENASFLRLRNISLGFDILRIQGLKIPFAKKLQLVFSGRNILTKTKYTGFDPELLSTSANSAYDRGVDNSTIPNLKSYQVSINLGF